MTGQMTHEQQRDDQQSADRIPACCLPDLLIDPPNYDAAAEEVARRMASRPDVFTYDGRPVVVCRSTFGAYVRRLRLNASTSCLQIDDVAVACIQRRTKGAEIKQVQVALPKALRRMWRTPLRKMQLRPLAPEFEPSKMAYREQRTWWDADRHPASASALSLVEKELMQWQRAMRSRAEHERGIERGPRTAQEASP